MSDETTEPVTTEETAEVQVPASEVAAVEALVTEAENAPPVDVEDVPATTDAPTEIPVPVEEVQSEPTAPSVVGLRFTAGVDATDRRYEAGDPTTLDELTAAGVDASTLTHLGVLVPVYAEATA